MWQVYRFCCRACWGPSRLGLLRTWLLVTRTERNRGRQATLVMAARALQDYRVAYDNWYVEYCSPSVLIYSWGTGQQRSGEI